MSSFTRQWLLRQAMQYRSSLFLGSAHKSGLLFRTPRIPDHLLLRAASSLYNPRADPGQYVEGATLEQMDSDPDFLEYLKANVPEVYDPDYVEGPLKDWSGLADIDERLVGILEREHAQKELEEEEKQKRRALNNIVHPRNIRPLSTYLRTEEETNSRRSNALRKQKLVPGIVVGGDYRLGISSRDPSSKILIKTPHRNLQRELVRYRSNFDSRVYNLTIHENEEDEEGTTHVVVPRDVDYHPIKNDVYCVNFCRYHPKRALMIPVKAVNEEDSAALKRDCFIIPIQRKIEVLVEEGVDIPEFLPLDCTDLKAKEVIRRDRILLPDGVKFSRNVMRRPFINYVVGKVEGSARGLQTEEEVTPPGTAAKGDAENKKKANEG